MRSAKIIVTGPVRAGTTTLIRSLSEIAVLSTERRLTSGAEKDGTSEATVALDFGRVTITRDLVLYLFGTPGEEPTSLACGPLAEGAIGVILVVDASRQSSVANAAQLGEFLRTNSDVPYVVAANRLGRGDEQRIAALRDALRVPTWVPIVPCEVTERESSKQVVLALLDRIIDTFPPGPSAGTVPGSE